LYIIIIRFVLGLSIPAALVLTIIGKEYCESKYRRHLDSVTVRYESDPDSEKGNRVENLEKERV